MCKKSCIREIKHLLTDADNSTDAIGGWTKNTQKPDNPTGSVVSTMFCKAKSAKKTFFLRGDFRPLPNKNVRPLLSITFPQGFRISKNIGHPTSGSWGKKTVKRYLKSEQTDRHTDRRTDKLTYRKHRPKGPMLWKVTFKFISLVLLSLIVNVLFCHEDGGGELCNLDILFVVS